MKYTGIVCTLMIVIAILISVLLEEKPPQAFEITCPDSRVVIYHAVTAKTREEQLEICVDTEAKQ